MNARIATAAALFGTLVATPVFAQEGSAVPSASVEESAAPAPRFTAGVQVEMMPTGPSSADLSLDGPAGHDSASFECPSAYGIGGLFAYDLTRFLSIGVAPRLITGVNFDVPNATSQGKDAKEFDLRARVAVHAEVAPSLQLYAFATPGYSWLIPPDDDNSGGFAIGFGGGAAYDLTPNLYVNAEVGYQVAYFSQDDSSGNTVGLDFGYLHLGLGGGTRF
jgi:hypothetical protein